MTLRRTPKEQSIRCYFCNAESTMQRRDMDVPVCDEHRRQERDTQPSLPLEPFPPFPNLDSAARAVGLKVVPRKRIGSYLNYTPTPLAVVCPNAGDCVTVPGKHYYWFSYDEKAIHWDEDREQTEHRMRGEGFI